MSRWQPCKRREFIKRLRQLDFEGPYTGTRHQFMAYKEYRLAIPSNTEYSVPLSPIPRCFGLNSLGCSNTGSSIMPGIL